MAQQSPKRTVGWLLVAAVGMFGFGFALVPLYDVFCEITGLNGKTGGPVNLAQVSGIDTSRTVRVQFLANTNAEMNWDFKPQLHEIRVHPGETTRVFFSVRNPNAHRMVAQAIPSVTPAQGADYFHKAECFCFQRQALPGGEAMDMGLVFTVDPALPADISTLTLSYTLFDVTEREGEG